MIDRKKKYQVRKGNPARIYATDCGGVFNVHGAVQHTLKDGTQVWIAESWTNKGGVNIDTTPGLFDLIEIPSPSMADES